MITRLIRRWGKLAFVAPSILALALVLTGGMVLRATSGGSRLAGNTVCTTCLSVTGPTASPVLNPGAPAANLPITLKNVTDTSLNVTSITVNVAFTGTSPAGCPVSEFAVNGDAVGGSAPTVSGSDGTTTITFPSVQPIAAGASWTYNTTLALPDNGSNQNACAGQGLSLTYTAAAQYTLLTTTGLGVTTNASGDSMTLTATVSPTDTTSASAGHTPGIGDGSVQFLNCTDPTKPSTCTALGSPSFSSSGSATLTVPAGTVGTDHLQAVFVPADTTNFVGSSSKIVNQSVTGCVNAQTSSASNIIPAGTTYNGNYEVTSGSSLWLNGGTITGSVTVDSGATFAASAGTVGGSVQTTGGSIAISGTTINGNVQAQNGGLSLGPDAFIKGNAQAIGGGPFCSQGSSPTQGQVQVKGNLLVQSLTSSTTASVCSTNVGNNLIWQSNSSPGLIGSCGANMILGNLQVQSNSGSVTVGAAGSGNGNTATGNVIVQSNIGGGTLTGNSSGGNCLMSSNRPGIVGTGNTAKGKNNQCNATA